MANETKVEDRCLKYKKKIKNKTNNIHGKDRLE